MDNDPFQNPYAAPRHQEMPPAAAPVYGHAAEPYRSAATLVALLTGGLGLYAVLSLAGVAFSYMELELFGTWPNMDIAEAEASDSRQSTLGMLQFVLNLTVMVVFAMFLHRSNKNARALSRDHFEFTPGWVVGWFFIPFANLVKPYQAVRELWWRSAPESDVSSSTGVLPFWWTAWLASSFLNQIVFRMSLGIGETPDVEKLMTISRLTIAAQVSDVVLCGLALVVVRGIHERLEQRAGHAAERMQPV